MAQWGRDPDRTLSHTFPRAGTITGSFAQCQIWVPMTPQACPGIAAILHKQAVQSQCTNAHPHTICTLLSGQINSKQQTNNIVQNSVHDNNI